MPGKAVLGVIMPLALKHGRLDIWIDPINETFEKYEINTPHRQAAWLANIAHETAELKWTREIWGPTPQQLKYDTDAKLSAGLGNTEPGDGKRFRGRGLPQLTGRGLYTRYAEYKGIPCVEHPEMIELPIYGADCGGWFWKFEKNMNPVADTGQFKLIVKKWNGGYNGWLERKAYYERALAVL